MNVPLATVDVLTFVPTPLGLTLAAAELGIDWFPMDILVKV